MSLCVYSAPATQRIRRSAAWASVGLRASEIALCRAEWFDWGDQMLIVPSIAVKKDRSRRIWVGFSPVWQILQAYFAMQDRTGRWQALRLAILGR